MNILIGKSHFRSNFFQIFRQYFWKYDFAKEGYQEAAVPVKDPEEVVRVAGEAVDFLEEDEIFHGWPPALGFGAEEYVLIVTFCINIHGKHKIFSAGCRSQF